MLEFIGTIESRKIAKHSYIVMQKYIDEDNKSIYNLSIEESDDGLFSETTDLFETKDEEKALSFYKILVKIYNYGKKEVNSHDVK